jgi:uncharacterized protein (TIGR00251 family)
VDGPSASSERQENLRHRLFTICDSRFNIYASVIRYSQPDRYLTFAVRVVPRASRSEVGGEHNGALRVRLSAPPVDGAANRELIRVIAKSFQVPKNAVEIVSGANSKNKIVRLQGADARRLEQLMVLK